ncbi:8110_t:CDS:10 [Entrophospora sp. SA101]|nr:8110_t:CDS:10 [Entrophospora sp. SA101]
MSYQELVDNLKKFYPQPPSVPLNTKEIFDHLKILYDDDNYIELEDNIDFDNDDSQIIIDDTRGLLKKFLEDVLRDTIIYMENGKRRTVTYMDVGDPSTAQPDSSNIVGSNVGSDTSTRKTPSSTPTQPTFNVWQVRQEAMNSKKAPELLNGNKDTNINNGNNGNYPTPAPIIPPLEDQNSWPAPAEVLIKDKEKEVNSESSEKKQSLPNELGLKKEESPKKGKGKWIPYEELTITHNPPLPGHDRPKTRRRSEDHAGYRDRRSSEKTPSPEARYQSSSSSVPPPLRENGRRYFNYNENNQNGNHISYNGSSSYRGSRRGGRGRSYNGQRGISRSASFSYTTPIYNHQNYGNFYGTKIGMDSEGYVDISLLAGFNRVKALTLEEEIIREALLNSHIVEVKGDKVRKRDEWGFWLLPKQVRTFN